MTQDLVNRKTSLSLTRRLVYSSIPLVLLLLLAELAARVFLDDEALFGIASPLDGQINFDLKVHYTSDPDLFWAPRPYQRREPGLWGDVTNSRGFRNREEPQFGDGRRRILCLGDSVTFGLGVGCDETWPGQLGRNPELQVFNGGVPGYSSHQGCEFYRKRCADLAPDVIIIEFGVNDNLSWTARQGDLLVVLSDRERAAVIEAGRSWSRLVQWVRSRRLPETAPFGGRVTVHTEPRVNLEEFRENLLWLARQAPRAVFLVWPVRQELDPKCREIYGTARYQGYQKVIRGMAETGHRVVDVEALFREWGADPKEMYLDSVHPTPEASRRVAEAVARLLDDS